MTPPAIHGRVRQAAGTLAASAALARAAGATDAAEELLKLSRQADAVADALTSYELDRMRAGPQEERSEG